MKEKSLLAQEARQLEFRYLNTIGFSRGFCSNPADKPASMGLETVSADAVYLVGLVVRPGDSGDAFTAVGVISEMAERGENPSVLASNSEKQEQAEAVKGKNSSKPE